VGIGDSSNVLGDTDAAGEAVAEGAAVFSTAIGERAAACSVAEGAV
jgi:hypothetical protein